MAHSLSLGTFGFAPQSNICSPLHSTPTTRGILPATCGLLWVVSSLSPPLCWMPGSLITMARSLSLGTYGFTTQSNIRSPLHSTLATRSILPATHGLLQVASSLSPPLCWMPGSLIAMACSLSLGTCGFTAWSNICSPFHSTLTLATRSILPTTCGLLKVPSSLSAPSCWTPGSLITVPHSLSLGMFGFTIPLNICSSFRSTPATRTAGSVFTKEYPPYYPWFYYG